LTATGVLALWLQPLSADWMRPVSGGICSWVLPDLRLAMVRPALSVAHVVVGRLGSVTLRVSPVATGGSVAAFETA
jgi:hypothetical protein